MMLIVLCVPTTPSTLVACTVMAVTPSSTKVNALLKTPHRSVAGNRNDPELVPTELPLKSCVMEDQAMRSVDGG